MRFWDAVLVFVIVFLFSNEKVVWPRFVAQDCSNYQSYIKTEMASVLPDPVMLADNATLSARFRVSRVVPQDSVIKIDFWRVVRIPVMGWPVEIHLACVDELGSCWYPWCRFIRATCFFYKVSFISTFQITQD